MLKNVLSLLLSKFYSKKENETISHLATPNIANTVNVMLTTTESSAIVAPFDGYLNIETTAEGNPTINIWEALWCNATPISPFQAKIFVPVTKGQRIQYRVTGTISQARFVRLVGGGYQTLKNALLQGGGLCLSHWYSSLQRNSYRTSGSGWLISQQFLFKALLNYLLLQMEKVTHSRCRTRGLSTSEVMEFGLPKLEGSISSISDHLQMGIFRSGLTLKKVKNLPTQLGNQISSLLPIFEYTKSRGTIDQMFGGASC